MEDIYLDPELLANAESFYFVIRNGLHTFPCEAFPVKSVTPGKIRISQEFRIAANPKVSITMFLRVRHRPGYVRSRVTNIRPDKLVRSRKSLLSCSDGSNSDSHIYEGYSISSDNIRADSGCLSVGLNKLLRKNTRSVKQPASSSAITVSILLPLLTAITDTQRIW